MFSAKWSTLSGNVSTLFQAQATYGPVLGVRYGPVVFWSGMIEKIPSQIISFLTGMNFYPRMCPGRLADKPNFNFQVLSVLGSLARNYGNIKFLSRDLGC